MVFLAEELIQEPVDVCFLADVVTPATGRMGRGPADSVWLRSLCYAAFLDGAAEKGKDDDD